MIVVVAAAAAVVAAAVAQKRRERTYLSTVHQLTTTATNKHGGTLDGTLNVAPHLIVIVASNITLIVGIVALVKKV